jgi:hypothetical protein
MFELHVVVLGFVIFYILVLIIEIMPNYSKIQNPNCRQFPKLTMVGFSDVLRPDKYTVVHFKRWKIKAAL